jgi:uncharacterized protein YrrD
MTIRLPPNARVLCADGPGGQLTDVIFDPKTEQVTHLVVETPGYGHPRHLVLVAKLASSDARGVHLRCSRDELARTEFFTDTETVPLTPSSTSWFMGDDALLWPLTFPQGHSIVIEHERVPKGELALRHDTPVEAIDGPVGRLSALVLQSEDDRVLVVILRSGHLWSNHDLAVPATAIKRIDGDAIHLGMSSARVQRLPPRPAAYTA